MPVSAAHGEADAIIVQGNLLEDKKKHEKALGKYLEAVQIAPDYPRAHLNAGNALLALGKPEDAIARYREALNLDSQYAYAYFNMGNALQELKRTTEAIAAYQQTLRLAPDLAEAYVAMACAIENTGDIELAITQCRKALQIRPNLVDGLYTLVRLWLAKKEPEKAMEAMNLLERNKATSATSPALLADAYKILGQHYKSNNQAALAESFYRKALELKPDNPRVYVLLGNLYQTLRNFTEANACFRQALSIDPALAEAHFHLGNTLKDQGKTADALASYRKALASEPNYIAARWAYAMAQIPAMPDPEEDIARTRNDFSRELAKLDAWFDAEKLESGHKAVGMYPFYLTYQEENNRNLLAQYGALCCKLMQTWSKQHDITDTTPRTASPIRIGIVSAFFFDHSVWHALVKGWIQHLNPDRFELLLFHTSLASDEETSWAKSHVAYYEQGGQSLLQWVKSILEHKPDILIYPEIGMDQMSMMLAALRLAPAQMVTWGHPDTSGLPTMDYFISAEDIEPLTAQENYTERLVSLPHLGCCYSPLQVEEMDLCLSEYGIDENLPIFLCPGTPYKYLPQHDWLLVEIAKRLGRCQFVFFTHSFASLSEKLRLRLETAFSQADLCFSDHIIFIPWLKRPEFYSLMKKADVVLDSIGFSGFNTAMQAIECGIPIVAWDGHFMRGRFASSILRQMGLRELIANIGEDYIALAVKLAKDTAYHDLVHGQIMSSRHLVFDDLAPIRALEEFLARAAHKN